MPQRTYLSKLKGAATFAQRLVSAKTPQMNNQRDAVRDNICHRLKQDKWGRPVAVTRLWPAVWVQDFARKKFLPFLPRPRIEFAVYSRPIYRGVMKHFYLSLIVALTGLQANAIYNLGDKPKNYCWKDSTDRTVCLNDARQVRVLLYNAGWCGPCKTEFRDLARATEEFKGKPVTFISLSFAGWAVGSVADKTFLQQWSKFYKLDAAKASFVVASSPHDPGKDFFQTVLVPSVVIVDASDRVAYKAINPGLSKLLQEVKKAIPLLPPTH
jgi:peroxiredoxin